MKIYEITQPVPITKRDMALKKQSDTALLKSKTSQDRMGLDTMVMVNKGMQDKIAQTQADANKLSKAAGIDPNTVNNMIKQNLKHEAEIKKYYNENDNRYNLHEEIINKNSGKVVKTEEWGLRNFSHKIKDNKKINKVYSIDNGIMSLKIALKLKSKQL